MIVVKLYLPKRIESRIRRKVCDGIIDSDLKIGLISALLHSKRLAIEFDL